MLQNLQMSGIVRKSWYRMTIRHTVELPSGDVLRSSGRHSQRKDVRPNNRYVRGKIKRGVCRVMPLVRERPANEEFLQIGSMPIPRGFRASILEMHMGRSGVPRKCRAHAGPRRARSKVAEGRGRVRGSRQDSLPLWQQLPLW